MTKLSWLCSIVLTASALLGAPNARAADVSVEVSENLLDRFVQTILPSGQSSPIPGSPFSRNLWRIENVDFVASATGIRFRGTLVASLCTTVTDPGPPPKPTEFCREFRGIFDNTVAVTKTGDLLSIMPTGTVTVKDATGIVLASVRLEDYFKFAFTVGAPRQLIVGGVELAPQNCSITSVLAGVRITCNVAVGS
jgi:hypothetical protein